MAKEAFKAVEFILAILYTLFFIISCRRSYQTKRFVEVWRGAKLLFICITIQTFCRLTSSWIVASLDDEDDHNILDDLNINSIIISVPDTLFIAGYMVLIWIVVSDSYNTRLSTHDLSHEAVINPMLTRIGRIIRIAILVWLLFMTLMYLLLVFDVIKMRVLNYLYMSANLCISLGVMIAYFIIQFKFSGIPFVNIRAENDSRKIFVISVIWTIGRTLHGVLFVFDRFNLLSISKTISGAEDGDILSIIIYISDILVTEMLCLYLVLESSFFRIFKLRPNSEVYTPLVQRSASPGAQDIHSEELKSLKSSLNFFIPENPELESSFLVTTEAFLSQESKLGLLNLGRYKTYSVLIRRVTFKRYNSYIGEGIIKDILDLREVDSFHLLPITGACIKAPVVEIVTAFISNGSLYKALHSSNVIFSESHRLKIARELAEGMRDLHIQGKVHGHLTSHNVLMDDEWVVKISDLGMSYLKKYASVDLGYTNKSAWSSPEMLNDKSPVCLKATCSDDVYSYGVILWEIFTGQEPFPEVSIKKLRQLASEGYRPNIPESLDDGISQLIKSCWNVDPKSRPDFKLIYNTLCMIETR
jgi:hypothetical protein